MSDDSFERMRKELDRVRSEFTREVKCVRDEMHSALEEARAEFERARIEFQTHMESARRQRRRATGDQSHNKGGRDFARENGFDRPKKRRRRPDGGLQGGEPVPVDPNPKPKPLQDGAEAPIE